MIQHREAEGVLRRTVQRVVSTAAILVAPRAAFACPVCFGQNDTPMAKAMNLGILAMLIVVAGILVSFASFFVVLARRARLAEESLPPQRAADVLEGSGPSGRESTLGA